MTIQRTREIFGKKMENWSDEQVAVFIENMSFICDDLLSSAIKELTNQAKLDNT